ncbi:MAG: hypothetical protein H0W54_04720 [Rubrobacter sp.]|nr:hypothetical protein [Rubrobacter sp.]
MLATPDNETTETVVGSFPQRHGRKLVSSYLKNRDKEEDNHDATTDA